MLSLCTAVLFRFSSIETSSLPTVTFSINGVALLAGGFISGHLKGAKGWYYGGIQGIVYLFTLLIINFLAFDSSIHISPLIFGAFAFGISALGGVIGVNLKANR